MKRFLKSKVKSTLILLLAFSLSSTVMAKDNAPKNLYEVLKVRNIPSTIRVDQLTADWRYITFNAEVTPDYREMSLLTKGKIISLGEQQYLVAYHLQRLPSAPNFSAQEYLIEQWRRDYDRSAPQFLKDSRLEISLLMLSDNRNFHEIKSFNPHTDVTGAPSMTAINRRKSLSNLKQIALATFMYVQDYNETLPPMVAARSADEIRESNTDSNGFSPGLLPPGMKPPMPADITATTPVQNLLMPYLGKKELFLQPTTHRPYLPNYKISQSPESKIDKPNETFLFYEDVPDADGWRCVAYADGHVKALTETQFQQQRKAQDISESGYPSAAKATPKP